MTVEAITIHPAAAPMTTDLKTAMRKILKRLKKSSGVKISVTAMKIGLKPLKLRKPETRKWPSR
ncbi:hypothetical protein GCM10011273_01400 [Asticcacaulis endophyticus]|uniref:Uncharacterized protein n=1 Tax=Asticcacaulis endophyticus TaxID=1395890 RepID=A0A918PU17_9CAUL|nr:hypothetical protein GCM10011273_01400 [Asticcacaulis endophyticus]